MRLLNRAIAILAMSLILASACGSKGKAPQLGPNGEPLGPGGVPFGQSAAEPAEEPEEEEEEESFFAAAEEEAEEEAEDEARVRADAPAEVAPVASVEPAVAAAPEPSPVDEPKPDKPVAPDVSSESGFEPDVKSEADVIDGNAGSPDAAVSDSADIGSAPEGNLDVVDAASSDAVALDAVPAPVFDKNASLLVFEEAKKFISKGEFPKAVELLEKWLERTPMDHVNRRNLIYVLMKLEDDEKAEFHLRFMTLEVPQEKEWWAHLGRIQSKLGKYTAAAETLTKAVELMPDDADLILDLARVHSKRKDWESARKILEKALDKTPENDGMLSDLAAVLVELGEYNAASATYRKLQRVKPTYETAITMANIASQYERCNDVIDALVDWEKSFVDETPHLLLASCALKAKELVKAQSHLMAGMKLNAKCFYCALWLGDLNFEAMDWPNSIKYYAIAAPLKPQDYRPFNQLGKALSNSGKHIEASRAFAKANERKPKDADIVYMWAMSLVRASDKGEAWKVWGQLDELDKKRAAEVRALLTQ